MNVRIGFSAEEKGDRQFLEAVDFAFSSATRPGQPRTARAGDR